jgi:O-glycosyl hydrolase
MESPSQPGIYLSAYKSRKNNQLVVVAINESGIDRMVQAEIEGAVASSVQAFRTSAKENLQALGRTPTSGHTLNLTLPGFSVTTFVAAVEPH